MDASINLPTSSPPGALIDFRLPLDESVLRVLNAPTAVWLDAVFVAASSRAFGLSMMSLAVVALVVRLRKRAGPVVLQLGLAVALTDLLGARLIKPFIGRVRPSFAGLESLRVLAPAANVGSMPSLHAANAFAVATVVVLAVPRFGWVAFPVAALIAVSRVAVGVHWPSDVALGALGGVAMACGVRLAARRMRGRKLVRDSL